MEQKRAYSKRVTLGGLIGEAVVIRDGLAGDEAIVVASQEKLRAGAEVSVVADAGAAQ